MNTRNLMIAGLLTLFSAAAFAQRPVAQVAHDNAQLRRDSQQLRQDRREIHHDQAVIAAKQGEVAAGRQQLHAERQQDRTLARAEHQAVAVGDLAGARQLAQARHAQQHVIAGQQQAIHHDERVIVAHQADKRAVQVARHEDKVERHLDQARRDRDAANI